MNFLILADNPQLALGFEPNVGFNLTIDLVPDFSTTKFHLQGLFWPKKYCLPLFLAPGEAGLVRGLAMLGDHRANGWYWSPTGY